MKVLRTLFLTALLSVPTAISAQNYDESKAGGYTLPELLEFTDGRKVKKKQWPERRQEILNIYQREMYGKMPDAPKTMKVETLEEGITLGGYGTRRQVRMWFSENQTGPSIDWLIVTPNHVKGPVPTILLLNYNGNHTVLTDKEVFLPDCWLGLKGGKHVFTDQERGSELDPNGQSIIPINMLIAEGYAIVTACYGDISPDPAGFSKDENGNFLQDYLPYTMIFDLWGKRDETRTDNTTSLAAWGWALRRGMDMIEEDPLLDEDRVVLTGYSRLAKAALVAGAFDERFPVVVLNQTGGGGVPLHKHYFGENVDIMSKSFTHWYCKAYAKYANNEQAMPFDQHMILSCIAPRALMVQGFDDGWFDTKGEFLAVQAASPAWELLGEKGLPKVEWPEDYEKSAVGPKVAYYRRNHGHGISAYDWVMMLDFANKVFDCKK